MRSCRVLDGFQLCRIWKTDDRLKSIPLVFYTASYTEPRDERFALSLGADRFILKPQEPEVLLALIEAVLARQEPPHGPVLDGSLGSEMEYLRRHDELLFDKLDKKLRSLQASEQLLQSLMENTPSLIYIVDREGRFLHVNRQLERLLGRARDEIIGRDRGSFLPADIAEAHRANDLEVLASGAPLTFEEANREPDGMHTYLTVKFPMQDERGRNHAVCGVSTDITENRKLAQDLQKLTDLQVLTYQVSRMIRSARTETGLFEAACRLCVDFGKFDLAWIGWVPLPGMPLRADFLAGPLAGYARGFEVRLEPGSPEVRGPSATCVREERTVVCQDWTSDPAVAPWRSRAGPYGIRSSASLLVSLEGHPLAVLNLYSVQAGFFTEERLTLIRELVEDLSHAIGSMVTARQREKAERALGAREAEYRAAFEQGAVGMAQVSTEGCFLKVNRRMCEIFGYSPGELVGRHVTGLTHPEDQPTTERLLQNLRSGAQETYTLQKRYVHKDGRAVWVDLNGSVVRDPEGRVIYYLSTFTDITQRKLAEQKILEEQAKLQLLIRTIPDLVWLKDADGAYLFCNPRFELFFGAPMEEILGRTDYDFVDRELADFFREHDRMAMEKEGPSTNEEWVTFASDGHRELLETLKTPMRDADGRVLGVLGISRNITQSHLDHERLRKLSNAIEHSPMVVVITDRDGTIEHVNPRFTELTGYTREEAVGANPRIIKSGTTPAGVYEDLWGTILSGRIWHGELQNRKKSGALYWESTSISPIFDDAGNITHFVALKEDITDLKRIQAELQDQLTELRRWHEVTLGREGRILDLKGEVNALLARLGEPPRYAADDPGEPQEGRP